MLVTENYKNELYNWDCIILKDIFHKYNNDIPKIGDMVSLHGKNHIIDVIKDDSLSYLMKFIDPK